MDKMMLPSEKVNTAKSSSFFKPTIQKKLSIGSANDNYEVEADAVANKVMRMQEPQQQNVSHTGALVQRKCTACEQEEKLQKKPLAENITPLIQRSSTESGGESQASNHIENQINNSKGSGNNMDHGTKNFMESRFGTDFSDVKIHTGSQAVQMSRELNAQAFTVGNDVYFNEGKYSPNTDSGKHLLAHELTHTVQQNGGIGRKIQMDRLPCTTRKTIDIYLVSLPGSTRNTYGDVNYANSVLCQCGINLNVVGAQSWQTTLLNDISPNDILNESTTINSELDTMLNHQPGGSDVIHVYFVPSNTYGDRGGSYGYPGVLTGVPLSVSVTNSGVVDTLAHEIVHILLRNGGHHPDPNNLIASGSIRNVGVDELTTSQCNLLP